MREGGESSALQDLVRGTDCKLEMKAHAAILLVASLFAQGVQVFKKEPAKDDGGWNFGLGIYHNRLLMSVIK